MLIMSKEICHKCKNEFTACGPYHSYECKRCHKTITLCDKCESNAKCDCGGELENSYEIQCRVLGVKPGQLIF